MSGVLGALIAIGKKGFQPSYESISSVSPSGVMVATLSSIPSTYKSLQVRVYAGVTSSGGALTFQMNGVTGNSYQYAALANDTSAAITSSVSAATNVQLFGTAKAIQTGFPLGCIIDIFDYASTTKFKTIRVQSAAPSNTGPGLEIYHGTLRSLTAITSFTITSNLNFSAGSSVALYGVN